MPPYRETTTSYLTRIVPDVDDLRADIELYIRSRDEHRPRILASIYSNYQKIRAAIDTIEDIKDGEVDVSPSLPPSDPTPEPDHPDMPPFDSGYPEGWD